MRFLSVAVLLAAFAGTGFAEDVYTKIAEIADPGQQTFPAAQLQMGSDSSLHIISEGTLTQDATTYSRLLGPNTVCVDVVRQYDLGGDKRQAQFQLVYYSLDTVADGLGTVKRGDVIGTASSQVRVVVASDTLDPYLVASSTRPPVKMAGKYWFWPAFLFPTGSTAYLTFDTCADFTKALADVASEASDPPGYVFYPSYRIRFETTLDALPVPLTDGERKDIAGYEHDYYGKSGLYLYKNEIQAGGYTYLICWQGKFDQYLKDEYTLGGKLWLYGNIVTYDYWKKTGYVFIRDFSLKSIETILADKLTALK
jgi:hypothetical protein